jgi:hypothetical protein
MQPELLEPKCLLGSINQGHHSHCAVIGHHQQLLVMPDGSARLGFGSSLLGA